MCVGVWCVPSRCCPCRQCPAARRRRHPLLHPPRREPASIRPSTSVHPPSQHRKKLTYMAYIAWRSGQVPAIGAHLGLPLALAEALPGVGLAAL